MKIDENNHAIELTRVSGDHIEFNELFVTAKEYFGSHHNA